MVRRDWVKGHLAVTKGDFVENYKMLLAQSSSRESNTWSVASLHQVSYGFLLHKLVKGHLIPFVDSFTCMDMS